MGWETHFDNTNWSSKSNATWDGSYWDRTNDGISLVSLTEAGTWNEGYLPTKIRITWTGSIGLDVEIFDTSANRIGRVFDISSPEEVDLDFAIYILGLDYFDITFSSGAVSITNIEFYVEKDIRINILDEWKNVTEVKINISDAWKDVTEMKINIGDAWEDIF